MNDAAFPSALRNLRQDLQQRNLLVALCGIAAILGVSGPFGTFEYFPFLGRLAYWAAVVFVTYCIGSLVTETLKIALHRFSTVFILIATTVAMTMAVTAFILLANGFAVSEWPDDLKDIGLHFLRIAPICAVIVGGSHLMREPRVGKIDPPALLDRLPFDKRGALVALSVSDHYVNVITSKGSEMVLMRLSDAIKESAPTVGLQTHRSHWIATGQVARVTRTADRALCTMITGDEIPVSRSFMPVIREAGLLPKAANG